MGIIIGAFGAIGYYQSDELVSKRVLNYLNVHERVFEEQSLNNKFVTYVFEPKDFKFLNGEVTPDKYTVSVDMSAFEDYLEARNEGYSDPVDAKIVKEADKFVIDKGKDTRKVDIERLLHTLNNDSRNIRLEDFTQKQKVTSKDLEETVKIANHHAEWVCGYEKENQFIRSSTKYVDITDDGGVSVNYDWIADEVRKVSESYNTVGNGCMFGTTSGELIKVEGGTWGREVNVEAEIEYVMNLYRRGESVSERTPIFLTDYNDIGDTYIEVSLDKQHLWYYADGKLSMETDIVTGNTSKKHNTPTGVYYISEKKNGKYLKGEDYKTWVNKWMRLNNRGIGLHDAYWRGSFGGSIYKMNGSHGCINLPKKFAYELYDEAYVGMPVIVY